MNRAIDTDGDAMLPVVDLRSGQSKNRSASTAGDLAFIILTRWHDVCTAPVRKVDMIDARGLD
jgi:hypothetical protein